MSINTIADLGQSVWFDYIQRSLIWTGELHKMVQEDGLRGVTSNPSIFEKAITSSKDYEPSIHLAVSEGASAAMIYEELAIEDVRLACDVLRPVYEASQGKDGFVSLEVSPHLAFDAEESFEEGVRLWDAVGRDNLMIKVPATEEGLVAIEQLIAEGINVNATLLFSVDRYVETYRAFMRGLELRIDAGEDVMSVASVASFFVSRIDGKVDPALEEALKQDGLHEGERAYLESLRGRAAISQAKLAYKAFKAEIESEAWKKLEAHGAQVQRIVWASTSTKNPAYRDVLYVEELIGPQTVNTVPEATYQAFKDHGEAESRLERDVDQAEVVIRELKARGIDVEAIAAELEEEGVWAFVNAYDRLIGCVEAERAKALGAALPSMAIHLDADMQGKLEARLEAMAKSYFTRRLWARDGSLFSDDPAVAEEASKYMGWLDIVDLMSENAGVLEQLQEQLEEAEIESVVLMGMGGSSLAPDVFSRTFGQLDGAPELFVLDSTVPAQVKHIEREVNLDATVFIVASKSGTTSEPLAFDAYFDNLVQEGSQFIAVTDPGSKLEKMAIERGFLNIYSGDPAVGGRFSALSPFGLVPAAAMGLDVEDLLERALTMIGSCEAAVLPKNNPGVRLGAALGELALAGRDKLTFVMSPVIASLGAWIEQLVAESTGKHGKGILPVEGEFLGEPGIYGKDRVFVVVSVDEEDEEWQQETEAKIKALQDAGHPVIRIQMAEREDLVQEMFRWEVATATAGYVLDINPFDQPNVQESKSYTSELLKTFEAEGKLPPVPGQKKLLEEDGITVYADEANAKKLDASSLKALIGSHLAQLKEGDYVALNAFIEMNEAHNAPLQAIRTAIQTDKKVASTVGFGPRFLHSTGQLHKGGANNGVFFQITADDAEDLPVPGSTFGFSVLKSAQEAGDFMALSARERRLIRVHLGTEIAAGLDKLKALIQG